MKIGKPLLTISVCVVVLGTAEAMSPPGDLPPAARGGAWVREDTVRSYAGEELFELIDGGAPLYFEYGFLAASAARYRGVPRGTVAAERYVMRSEGGAFGLYSYLSAGSGHPATVGMAGT